MRKHLRLILVVASLLVAACSVPAQPAPESERATAPTGSGSSPTGAAHGEGEQLVSDDRDYIAASSFSKDGFARDAETIRELEGQMVKIWGFVDHNNLYGDEGAQAILGDWWSGTGPNDTTWRFNLKAQAHDAAGKSFAVYVPNDEGRDELLKAFLADARAQKPTKVFVKGTIFTFDAPTNAASLTGLRMDLSSSHDILLEPSEDR